MPQIQDVIHRFEEGSGIRYVKYGLIGLALIALMLSYNLRGFKDMSNPEAMDMAQLARNISEGNGYTTLFVRPFSMYLLKTAYEEKHGPVPRGERRDVSQIKGLHPDIANPPVYPVLLSGLMAIAPGMRYQTAGGAAPMLGAKKISFWNFSGAFWIYPPDFWISLFNQVLFLITAAMVFLLARQLFGLTVAGTCAAIYLGTDIFWQFSISGLSTILVILIFLSLTMALMRLEEKTRAGALSQGRQIFWAGIVGALTGAGCLTRYSFGWLILPVLIFCGLFLGRNRVTLCLVALAVFAAVVSPWIYRNYQLSHTAFGTAGYAVYENTAFFPEFRLGRSLNPDLSRVRYDQLWNKFISNLRVISQEDLPRLGGSWISAFFLVGLMGSFKNKTAQRLRIFVLLCLPFLMAAQALGRTQLFEENRAVNSENLVILLAPVVIIFGVSFFYLLLDQMKLPIVQLRYLIVGIFCAFVCLPALLNFFSPRTMAVAYPPYFPPIIQQTAGWMKPDELMMSDIPWALAWYGKHQCIWLTLNAQEDFFAVSDYQKTVSAVYLTPVTLDSRILSQWVRAAEYSWGSFALDCMLRQELPQNFPLKHAPDNFLPEQLFLTDSDRWIAPSAAGSR